MIYLKLFLTFLEVGALSFGGGLGMISLIREAVVSNNWLSESDFMSFIAVSESTPGPVAVNIATFIGSSQAGILGSLVATIGVVLPSFIIILIIAALISNLLKFAGVNAFLSGVRPCVVGMVIATAITMGLNSLVGIAKIGQIASPDIKGIIIFGILIVAGIVSKKIFKKSLSPIMMIIISAVLGIGLYSI